MMAACIRNDMECAALCYTTAQLMSIGSDKAAAICAICADACERCSEECAKHDNEHCQECAASCKACAKACRKMGTK